MLVDCVCNNWCREIYSEAEIFGNRHHPNCEKYERSSLAVYAVDCGETDTVLANSFMEALQLANTEGCNTEFEENDTEEVTVRKLPFASVRLLRFDDGNGVITNVVEEIIRNKTPRVLCSSIW